jgi:hypothetical protein
VIDRSVWALEILAELGFTYDSSIFPIHHDRYGMPGAPRVAVSFSDAFGPADGVSHHHVSPGWAQYASGWRRLSSAAAAHLYTRLGLKRVQKEGLPIVVYIHPWEIDPEQPRLPGG